MYRKIAAIVSTVGAMLVGLVLLATPAHADNHYPPALHQLVMCESGGNTRIVNDSPAGAANDYPGGLYQIIRSTWRAHGGTEFAPTAEQASPYEQWVIGHRIWQSAPGSWACPGAGGFAAGWHGGAQTSSNASVSSNRASAESNSSSETKVRTVPAKVENDTKSSGEYKIKSGDTLTQIARAKDTTVKKLKRLNRKVIEHVDWIFPGEQIKLKKQQQRTASISLSLATMGAI